MTFARCSIVDTLAYMFGAQQNGGAVKALGAIVLINADTAHKRIIPELIETFS
jgi:hypothetical protein